MAVLSSALIYVKWKALYKKGPDFKPVFPEQINCFHYSRRRFFITLYHVPVFLFLQGLRKKIKPA